MHISQLTWRPSQGWSPAETPVNAEPQLVFVFFGTSASESDEPFAWLRAHFPKAILFGCSTAGEIRDTRVEDDGIVATAVTFERTTLCYSWAEVTGPEASFDVGRSLAAAIPHGGLAHAVVVSDGLRVNGSELVRGLTAGLPAAVTVTGGLSGDGARFQRTAVLCDGRPRTGVVTILGLYGDAIAVGYGSLGGWDSFGPERLITRSKGNVLFELDGQPALALYKAYLGDYASGLPATGLLFPLSLRTEGSSTPVVRTILSVNEADGSLTFAGDVPEGSLARLMKANFDRLVDGAIGAARSARLVPGTREPDLALLVSCVGRKLVLAQRIEEEVEGVRSVLGSRPVLTGFYSYGEISPFTPSAKCELHNQTMTITTFAEAA
jgi:hypothetical protein